MGLRLTVHRRPWFRLDAQPPEAWSWAAMPVPRYRFDSASGARRVRYAGDGQRVAMRERFDASARVISAGELGVRLVRLSGPIRVLDLRLDRNLDALGLDDQINTSRSPQVWSACQLLSDLAASWYGDRLHGIVYRSRTTPQRSVNLALFAGAPLQLDDLGPLVAQTALLASCVLSDGFAVQDWAPAQ